tara:strand:- start:180 stop:971 length:792 start_codon:yes stop_codon:yes gene_type:complete
MKEDIYEMIFQNMMNEYECSFENNIGPLIKEITTSLNLGNLIDSKANIVNPNSTQSPFQQILSKVPYCIHLDKVIKSCEDYDPKYANKYMQEYEGSIEGQEEDFKINHSEFIKNLKGLSSVINDVAYLAIYELDRMTGWTGPRNGNPEEAFSKDLQREAREAFSRDLQRKDSEYKNTEVLLSALEILDNSLDRYTGGNNRRLSLKERVEENIKDLKRELELDTKEGVSTTASSTDIGKPKAEIAQIIANDVINSLVENPSNGR